MEKYLSVWAIAVSVHWIILDLLNIVGLCLYLCDMLIRMRFIHVSVFVRFLLHFLCSVLEVRNGGVGGQTRMMRQILFLFSLLLSRLCKTRVNVSPINWNGQNMQIIQSHSTLVIITTFFFSSANNVKKAKQRKKRNINRNLFSWSDNLQRRHCKMTWKKCASLVMHAKQVILIILEYTCQRWTKIDIIKNAREKKQREWLGKKCGTIQENGWRSKIRKSHAMCTKTKGEGKLSPQCNQITQTYVIFTQISLIRNDVGSCCEFFSGPYLTIGFYLTQSPSVTCPSKPL